MFSILVHSWKPDKTILTVVLELLCAYSAGRGPKTVKLFTNQPHTMDFDQAEAQRPIQQFELAPDQLSDDGVVGLNYVKYQNVQNLTVSTSERSIREFSSTFI